MVIDTGDDSMDYKKLSQLFKVFSDETRLQVIDLVKNGDHCACTIINQLSITQPTLSHHLKVLSESNITKTSKKGNWKHHHIDGNHVKEMILYLQSILES